MGLPGDWRRRLGGSLAGVWAAPRPVRSCERLPSDRPCAARLSARPQPRRTYDPSRVLADPVGDHVPSYLAQLALRDAPAWEALRANLGKFGREAELFDEIKVRRHGPNDMDPFQVQVRKFGQRAKDPFRNLVDVGYGVSQVLPVVTELLRDDGASTLLLQQPEVHLHPRAQAALGSLLAQAVGAARPRQSKHLIVETHSDFIIDRVRMAAADESNPLRPEQVAIVYFERCDLDVTLHSISVDGLGHIEGAPPNYRQFFLQELQKSMSF